MVDINNLVIGFWYDMKVNSTDKQIVRLKSINRNNKTVDVILNNICSTVASGIKIEDIFDLTQN